MKKLILTAFIAFYCLKPSGRPGMLVSSTGAFAQASCDSGAPEAWFRPGGYCASIGAASFNYTLPLEGGCTDFEYNYPEVIGTSGVELRQGARASIWRKPASSIARMTSSS